MASIPPSVLGGAALVMFGTVAAVGIQTLGRVDFNNHRNVVVVAVSIGIAMIPVGLPQVDGTSAFLVRVPDQRPGVPELGHHDGQHRGDPAQPAAQLLGRRRAATAPRFATGASVRQLNAMPREKFVATVAPAYQGDAGIAEAVADRRPFADGNALRAAMQDQLFSLPRGPAVGTDAELPVAGRRGAAGRGPG